MKTLYNTLTTEAGQFRSTPYTVNGKPGTLPDNIVELDVVRTEQPTGDIVITETGYKADLKAKEYRQFYKHRDMTKPELIDRFNAEQEAKDQELDILKLKEVLRGLSDKKEFMLHYKAKEQLKQGDKRIYKGDVLTSVRDHMTDIDLDSENYNGEKNK